MKARSAREGREGYRSLEGGSMGRWPAGLSMRGRVLKRGNGTN